MASNAAAEVAAGYLSVRVDFAALNSDLAKVRSLFSGQIASLSKMAGNVGGAAAGGAGGLGGLAGAAGAAGGALATLGTAALAGVAVAIAGVAAGAVGLAVALKESVSAASEAEQSMVRLDAVLRATGFAAGFNAEQLGEMASQLQLSTQYGDEQIKDAMAKLATFRSVSGDIFERATSAATDLAAVGFGDLASSAVMVGKALEDPERGLLALRRAGVSFSESQRKVIKDLVETGETAKAQEMILQGIEEQVGGVAKAMGNTFSGALTQMRNQFGEIFESAGTPLLNMLKPFATELRDFFAGLSQSNFGGFFEGFEPAVLQARGVLQDALSSISGFLSRNGDTFRQWAQLIGETLGGMGRNFRESVGIISEALGGMGAGGVWEAAKDGITSVLHSFAVLTASSKTTWAVVQAGAELAWSEIMDTVSIRVPAQLRAAWAGITAALQTGWKETVSFIDTNTDGMASRVVSTLQAMAAAFGEFAKGVADKFRTLAEFIPGVFGHIGQALAGRLAQLGQNPNVQGVFNQAKIAAGAAANEPGRQLDVAKKMAAAFLEAQAAALQGVQVESQRTALLREAFRLRWGEAEAQLELNRLVAANRNQIAGQVGAIGLGAMPGMGGLGAMAGIMAQQGPGAGALGGLALGGAALGAQQQAKQLAAAVEQGAEDGTKAGQTFGLKDFHKNLQEQLVGGKDVPKRHLKVAEDQLELMKEMAGRRPEKGQQVGLFGE